MTSIPSVDTGRVTLAGSLWGGFFELADEDFTSIYTHSYSSSSIAASGSENITTAGLPNWFNIGKNTKLDVDTQSATATSVTLEFFSDSTFAAASLLKSITNTTPFVDVSAFFLEDTALNGNIYVRITNNSGVAQTFDVEQTGDGATLLESDIEFLLCSGSMGWMPGDLLSRNMPGDYTVLAQENTDGSFPVYAARGNKDRRLLDTFNIRVNVCLAAHTVTTTFNNDVAGSPAFVFLGLSGGAWVARSISARDVAAAGSGPGATLAATAWDNELNRVEGEIRLAQGLLAPYIVTFGPSTLQPGSQAFYLRELDGVSTTTAKEILVDPSPTTNLDPVFTRFQAVGLEDGTINIYYEVNDSSTGFRGTAVMAYNPELTKGGPNNLDGLILSPTFLFQNQVPLTGPGHSVTRHPATGEILIALFDTSNDTAGKQIRLAASRGSGILFDATQFVLNGTNHPHYLGGRWAAVCTNFVVDVDSLGWTGKGAGDSFILVAGYTAGTFSTVHKDFVNGLDPANTNGDTARRPFFGEIFCKRDEESMADGTVEVLSRNGAPFEPSEARRQGYSTVTDHAGAVLLMRFDGIDSDTVLTLIGPTATSNETLPGPGVISTGRVFFADGSLITVDGSGSSLDMTSVTVSGWFFLDDPGAAGLRFIAGKMRGVGQDPSWRLEYDVSTQQLNFVYATVAPATITVASGLLLPPGYWYHIIATYDAATGVGQLFVYGVLVAANSGAADALNDSAGSDILIGDADSFDPAQARSFRGRIDDFMVGSTPVSHTRVLLMLQEQVSESTGPVFASHDATVEDRVMETAIFIKPPSGAVGLTNETVTVTAREVNLVSGIGLSRHVFYDVWKRGRGENPVYLGVLPAPPSANDFLNSANASFNSYNPRLSDRHRLNPTLGFSATAAGEMAYFHALRTQKTPGEGTIIVRTTFDPDDISTTVSHTVVAWLNTTAGVEFTNGMAVLAAGAPISNHVIFVATYDFTTNASSTFYGIRPADFGLTALATAPSVTVPSLMPLAADTLDSVAWATNFTAIGEEPQLCGIAIRKIAAGMGFPTPVVADDMQLWYGAATPGTATDNEVLFGTASVVIDVTALNGGTITLNTDAVQVDEYGHGGIDPFAPIKLCVDSGLGAVGSDDYSDAFMLGVSGTRPCEGDNVGNSGLALYNMGILGTWGLKKIASIGLDAVPSDHNFSHGADAIFSFDAIEAPLTLTLDKMDDPFVVVSRPYPDGQERTSTVYLTPNESTSAGWRVTVSGSVVPVLHPASEPYTCVWDDVLVKSRHFTVKQTGSRIVKTGLNQAMPILHWLATGEPDVPSVPNVSIANPPALQGGSYSSVQKLQRFWNGSFEAIRPAIGGKNFRVDSSGFVEDAVLGRNIAPFTSDRIEPVGMTEEGTFGQYFFVKFNAADTIVLGLDVHTSPYVDELGGTAVTQAAWRPTFVFDTDVHKGMRTVAVGGRSYAYFIFGTATKSQIFFAQMPVASLAMTASTDGPKLVKSLDFVAKDRIYAVPLANGNVVIYVGDTSTSSARRTVVLVHDPVNNIIDREPKVVVSGSSPFRQSYGACPGRVDHNLDMTIVLLEPGVSREGAGGKQALPAAIDDPHGINTWNLATFVTDGYFLLEQAVIDGDDLIPHFGDAAVSGGKYQARARPHFIARMIDTVATNDLSTEYVFQASVKETTIGDPSLAAKFFFNAAAGDINRTDFGNDRLLVRTDPTAFPKTANEDTPRLVPGALQLEVVGGLVHDGNYYSNIGGIANKLQDWRPNDANSESGGTSGPGYVMIQDHILGSKAVITGPDKVMLVGYYKQGS